MSRYSKFNLIYRLQKWMDSVPGQTFLNYAYSWGASIVIFGTLCKLTHLPGANFWLFVGMGTEVFVFFLSAFDRPFDKTADGMELPTRVTAEYLDGKETAEEVNEELHGKPAVKVEAQPVVSGAQPAVVGGGTIVIQGGGGTAPLAEGESAGSTVGTIGTIGAGSGWVAQQQETTPGIQEAQSSYIDQLKKLVETLEKVNEQSERLTRDSEEMENLNRTLTGISRVYEMQLKGASQQIGTIDQINEQSRHLAQQIEKLNQIYARMIEAMTVNMPRAAAPQQPA